MSCDVSVIIPVHNVENYLKKCIESVINQTFYNIEIILINDSSTDDSERICQEYVKIDDRIKYSEFKGGSAGKTRNFGLMRASGKYVIFVDSDDFINCDMIEKLYNCIIEYNSDVCFCAYNKINNNYIQKVFIDDRKVINYKKNEICDDLIFDTIYVKNDYEKLPLYAVWNGIYKLDIIKNNNILFLDESKCLSEDSIFNFEYLLKCNCAVVFNEALYNHLLTNSDSICNKYHNRYDFIQTWYNHLLKLSKTGNLNQNKTLNLLQEKYVNFSISMIKQEVLLSDKNFVGKIEKLKSVLDDEILITSLRNIDLGKRSKKNRILLFLMKYKLKYLLFVAIELADKLK